MTLEDKRRIYDVLQAAGPLEGPQPLARVGLTLAQAGIRCEDLGYGKMKQMFLDLPEFIDLEMVMLGQNPHPMVTVRPWDGSAAAAPGEAAPVAPGEAASDPAAPGEAEAAPAAPEEAAPVSSAPAPAAPEEAAPASSAPAPAAPVEAAPAPSAPTNAFDRVVKAVGQSMAAYARLVGLTEQQAHAQVVEAYDRAAAAGALIRADGLATFDLPSAQAVLRPNRFAAVDGFPWIFTFVPEQQDHQPLPERKVEEAPDEGRTPPNPEQRREIYQLLTERLALEQKHHMAAVSMLMVEAGHTKERYGYSKMKPLLQSMGDFLSFEEQIINGVPQTLVTIHAVAQWQERLPQSNQDPYEQLPLRMEEGVYLPPKSLARLNAFVTGHEGPPSEQTVRTLQADYNAARARKDFWIYGQAYCFALSLTDPQGQPLCAAIKASDYEGGAWAKPWYMNFAGINRSQPGKSPGQALEQFAYLGPWPVFLESLAKRAIRETWDFQGQRRKPYFILQKYIQYTFYRLQLEDKICVSENEDFAAFNTGLVTEHYDDIYACFEPRNDGWRFIDFCTAASRGLGKRLVDAFNPLPQPASYFERKEDLLFDLDKDLHTDYEHILLDNLFRLPLEFLREECHGDAEAQRLILQIEQLDSFPAQRAAYEALSNLIAENPRLFNRLRNRLDDAIELARKKVRWNFKTAIPCFFPTRNVMSLMLPLSLCDNGRADAALVVELTRSGNYQGQTILTLQQAYVDARLLCQPNSEWLDAQGIEQGLEE